MARCLIIGCGCRGSDLARGLIVRGHAVRATTRDPDRLPDLHALGVESVLGDPDRVATLVRTLDHVSLAYVLLGSAAGPASALQALHSTRLDMLLSKIVDSTVRGIVYEAAGSVPARILAAGAQRVRSFCEDARVPYALLTASPGDPAAWTAEALAAADRVLASR